MAIKLEIVEFIPGAVAGSSPSPIPGPSPSSTATTTSIDANATEIPAKVQQFQISKDPISREVMALGVATVIAMMSVRKHYEIKNTNNKDDIRFG